MKPQFNWDQLHNDMDQALAQLILENNSASPLRMTVMEFMTVVQKRRKSK